MSFETAVTAGFVAGYGYVARETYRALQEGRSQSMYHYNLRKRKPSAVITPSKAPVIRRTAPTQAPEMRGLTVHTRTTRPWRTSNYRTLGRRPGKYGSRKRTISADNTSSAEKMPSDKSVSADGLIFVEQQSTTSQINKRRGELVNIRGVKVRYFFKMNQRLNPTNAITIPVRVRWAIIIPKADTLTLTTVGTAPNSYSRPALPNFFINENPVDRVAKDFDTSVPNPGNHWDMFNRKINREEYSVLKEGQFILCQDGGNGELSGIRPRPMRTYKHLNFYIPIKRQMHFTGTGGEPDANVYMLYWYAFEGSNAATKDIADNADKPFVEFHEKTTYFTNSDMFK
ncbi:putative capsid protein [Aretevirus marisnaco]|uniref:Putative capsid protein n=1 Tax=Marine snail associated circular virus TaxID=1692255 RepID=A0A0K1RL13_9CIRC|nr:putative capsid protein [Marine snail associated circular virus]AKV62275.1 putative capsid protein [Marine snail associated circular virus]